MENFCIHPSDFSLGFQGIAEGIVFFSSPPREKTRFALPGNLKSPAAA